jgi:hypothetical protein
MGQKSMIDILDETVEYYTNNPRSSNPSGYKAGNNRCLYNGLNGEKCGFSRCCIDDIPAECEGIDAVELLGTMGEEILKPEYRGYSSMFWKFIQLLHDTDEYWGDDGLTQWGIERVAYLKIKFGNVN